MSEGNREKRPDVARQVGCYGKEQRSSFICVQSFKEHVTGDSIGIGKFRILLQVRDIV